MAGYSAARLVASLVAVVFLAACHKNEPASNALIGRWEGVRLTRDVEGQHPQVGAFAPGDCIIEYRRNGTYRVESRGAPNFDGNDSASVPPTPLIFTGRYEVTNGHTLLLTI